MYVDLAFPTQRVAVDVVSPMSFEPGSARLNFRSLARKRLLRQLGWSLVRLASDEVWPQLDANDQQQQRSLRRSLGVDTVPSMFVHDDATYLDDAEFVGGEE